ncbi:SMI1/KNR4 family protein [Roseivirga sp. BDSF3-8]|uniref:SMI1/KNR4 family protein n=1 Tax=Roseivirga sp. BDSF3-8 TaxID=3241598 RepID=UPI00353270F0
MTPEDISYIESQLKVTLPDHYTDMLLRYPEDLKQLDHHGEYLIDDPYYLIRLNTMFGRSGVPEKYFAIGHNLGGDYYFIQLNSEETTVYYFDHEETADSEAEHYWDESLNKEHDNLEEYKNWLIETLGG